jgi:hypothetical protein
LRQPKASMSHKCARLRVFLAALLPCASSQTFWFPSAERTLFKGQPNT